jgi:hypothetical protein
VAPNHVTKGRIEVQPTEIQVQRSLAALREAAEPIGDSGEHEDVSPDGLPDGLVELLSTAPAIRLERMVDARRRLDGGSQPSDEDLADRLVGRLVCDRLR